MEFILILKNNIKINIFTKIIFILCIYSFCNLKKNINIKNYIILEKYKNISKINKFTNFEGKYEIKVNKNIYIIISDIQYYFSFKFKIVNVNYKFNIYDKNKKLIIPSNNNLFNNISFICYYKIIKGNISIDSLANIHKNEYFNCKEFFRLKEKINLGIKIFQIKNNISNYNTLLFFNEYIINYNSYIHKNDKLFDSLYINNEYYKLLDEIKFNHTNKPLKIKKYYKRNPNFILKNHNSICENQWHYINIFNNYYCFCKGHNCSNIEIFQACKYYFYIYIIDNNRYIYKKTDYLFSDFIFAHMPPDDTYPVFEKMKSKHFPVHYITERKDIYNKYCYNINNCITIILINRNTFYKFGDFLEKYIDLILKLKAVISGKIAAYYCISKLFYYLEYITYIAVGHGVCYFKTFLYRKNRLYGIYKNNKILIPPSNKIINIAKKYGWKDKDIIKINLPRWDKFNQKNLFKKIKEELNNNSIFIMFTWRDIKRNMTISSLYIKNIFNLLKNDILKRELIKNNITLYFSLHRYMLRKYRNIYEKIVNKNNNYFRFLRQTQISECLTKTNLVVSDFSSIIFDLMYRRKPIIMFIPDANDPTILYKYKKCYFDLVNYSKNKKFFFENKYFTIEETVNKIVYYINNNFTLDTKLIKLYDKFGFKTGNNINKFIKYLKDLK